ncbi:MAG: AAA family ATPase [Tissierellia bacterium]|nr:AAA family ATPase [Tissierellia bacterium]
MNLYELLENLIEEIVSKKYNVDQYYSERIEKDMEPIISKIKKILHENESLLKTINNSNNYYYGEEIVYSRYIQNVYSYYNNIKDNSTNDFYNIKNYLELTITDIDSIISVSKRVPYLGIILSDKQKTVLVGANGSGKSSFASFLKLGAIPNIKVIPESKFLYIYEPDRFLYTSSIKELESTQIKNITKADSDEFPFISETIGSFTTSIGAFANEYTKYATGKSQDLDEYKNVDKSVLDDLLFIWNLLFTDIKIFVDSESRTINAIKNGNKYHVNRLSDGERAVLYYCCNILLAMDDSIIVIDEPETYLNDNIAVKLWNALGDIRKDCKFIFITHNLEFAANIGESHLVWCQNYKYPDDWDIEELSLGEFPLELTIKIASSKKPILYCEGDIDKLVYEALFGDKFTVIKVGGCLNVIDSVRFHKLSSIYPHQECVGIIDYDNINRNEGELNQEGIFVLFHNEVEMFLMDELVLKHTMQKVLNRDCDDKFEEYKEHFFQVFEKSKDKIIYQTIKNYIENHLSKEKLELHSGSDDITASFVKIINSTFKSKNNEILTIEEITSYIDQMRNELEKKLEEIINEQNYKEALRYCNLKDEVSKGVANRMESNYMEKAVSHITDEEFINEIIQEYFLELDNYLCSKLYNF